MHRLHYHFRRAKHSAHPSVRAAQKLEKTLDERHKTVAAHQVQKVLTLTAKDWPEPRAGAALPPAQELLKAIQEQAIEEEEPLDMVCRKTQRTRRTLLSADCIWSGRSAARAITCWPTAKPAVPHAYSASTKSSGFYRQGSDSVWSGNYVDVWQCEKMKGQCFLVGYPGHFGLVWLSFAY